jgi:exopolysaccharide biosynthesis protein
MAERLLELGCTDALNLDGGGSSTMLVAGQSKTPVEARLQRPVGNALFVVRRPAP